VNFSTPPASDDAIELDQWDPKYYVGSEVLTMDIVKSSDF
jgi:hypothetical protein